MRGIYGGIPQEIVDSGRSLREFGVDAVWLGSGSYTAERLAWLRAQKVQAYAEFNTLHVADYLKAHPDAAPVGTDGRVSPAPDGWQGICPTHEAYRAERMRAFRTLLETYAIDGVWLDYHHSHASWEQATPNMPDTCFCDRCLLRFQKDTAITLPQAPTPERAALLLSTHRDAWVRWRLGVFTDWVREFRDIRDATRPGALLGTFHNPWSDEDFGGARLEKLAIDLRAQAAFIDVFSPMPYHARFGHAGDPAWISRQVAWLGHAPRRQRSAGRAAAHLAHRADLRLGRAGAGRADRRGVAPWRARPGDRRDGLRLGRPPQAAGEDRRHRADLPRARRAEVKLGAPWTCR